MRKVWAERTIDAPASVVWQLVSEVEHWPAWGPSVRMATVDGGRLRYGANGRVTTIAGVTLPFTITSFVEGRSWSWDVAGVGATDHRVDAIDGERCRVGFGVPWVVAPYAVICHAALRRLEALAVADAFESAESERSV